MRVVGRLVVAGLAAGGLAACSGHGSTPTGSSGLATPRPWSAVNRPACPANPLLGVYSPSRLEVKRPCVWFRGTVKSISPRSDGDMHIDVAPDPRYASMLNDGNRKDQNGNMVVEVMPGQPLPLPQVGEHVALFGTWVHDQHNDWDEIHPVWAIRNLDNGTVVAALPPATPEYSGTDS